MLTCNEVSKLVSQSLDRRLSLVEWAGLRIHFFLCEGCRHFRKQMAFIRRACQRYLD
jgi:hypothetical protein